MYELREVHARTSTEECSGDAPLVVDYIPRKLLNINQTIRGSGTIFSCTFGFGEQMNQITGFLDGDTLHS